MDMSLTIDGELSSTADFERSPSNLPSPALIISPSFCSSQFWFLAQPRHSFGWSDMMSSYSSFLVFLTFSVFVLMTIPSCTGTMHEACSVFAPSTSTTQILQEPTLWTPSSQQRLGMFMLFLRAASIMVSPS